MSIALLLIPLSLAMLGGFVYALFWAVDNDQFEDLDTVHLRLLDEAAPGPAEAPTAATPATPPLPSPHPTP